MDSFLFLSLLVIWKWLVSQILFLTGILLVFLLVIYLAPRCPQTSCIHEHSSIGCLIASFSKQLMHVSNSEIPNPISLLKMFLLSFFYFDQYSYCVDTYQSENVYSMPLFLLSPITCFTLVCRNLIYNVRTVSMSHLLRK